jgi:hypothetical protein
MGGLFSKPKIPVPPPVAPPPPTMGNASADVDVAAQEMARSLQRGRTSTMLTGGAGLTDLGDTTKKQLLGG